MLQSLESILKTYYNRDEIVKIASGDVVISLFRNATLGTPNQGPLYFILGIFNGIDRRVHAPHEVA